MRWISRLNTTLHWKPMAKARPRLTKSGRAYTPATSRKAEAELAIVVREALAASKSKTIMAEVPVALSVILYLKKPKSVKRGLPSVKPDIDNYIKTVMDACTKAGAWMDDGQVVDLTVKKVYSDSTEKLFINILEWEP